MLKSRLFRARVQKSESFVVDNLLQLTIENYSSDPLKITISDVETFLPPVTAINGTPVPSMPFIIDSQVCPIEKMRFSLEFQNDIGDAVIAYTTLN